MCRSRLLLRTSAPALTATRIPTENKVTLICVIDKLNFWICCTLQVEKGQGGGGGYLGPEVHGSYVVITEGLHCTLVATTGTTLLSVALLLFFEVTVDFHYLPSFLLKESYNVHIFISCQKTTKNSVFVQCRPTCNREKWYHCAT